MLFTWAALLTPTAARAQSFATGQVTPKPAGAVRFATFNASLNRGSAGQLVRDLSGVNDAQARNVAEVIQRVRPDVLLVNEFDHGPEGRAAALFQDNYLGLGQGGLPPIFYPYRYTAEVNTGVPSGADLDNDGRVVTTPGSRGYGNDAIGFGQFPGQYGMVLYSNLPIDADDVRRFDRLLWRDMPGALLPKKADGSPWYSEEALKVLRLSSKGHWDVPVRAGGTTIHALVSHPTPPAFDGPEDRNGRRNHDEIRLWADYLTGGPASSYLAKALPTDTGLEPPRTFVILGDMNADPDDGGSVSGAIQQLLGHTKVNASFVPRSEGARSSAREQGGENRRHRGDPTADTADFADGSVGNLRVDYVLPSRDLSVLGGGVFWPGPGDSAAGLVAMEPSVATSDHRLVWLDLKVP
jgi:3-phytase